MAGHVVEIVERLVDGEALRRVLALRDVEHAPRFGRRRGRLGLSGDGGTMKQQGASRAESGEHSNVSRRGRIVTPPAKVQRIARV